MNRLVKNRNGPVRRLAVADGGHRPPLQQQPATQTRAVHLKFEKRKCDHQFGYAKSEGRERLTAQVRG